MFFKKKKEENINNRLTAMELKLHCSIILQAASERRRVRNLPPGTPLAECEFKVLFSIWRRWDFATSCYACPHFK